MFAAKENVIRPLDQYTANPVIDYYDTQEALLLARSLQTSEGKPPEEKRTIEEQPIFESYDIRNEVDRMKELANLTDPQKKFYIEENLLSFFEEFAAQITVKKLAGVLKDDGSMEILGTNVTSMYDKAASVAGAQSREEKEKRGLDTISQELRRGANRAIWLSPPKIADYSFAFDFVRDEYDPELGGYPFREILLRYDEPMGKVEKSKQVFNTVQALLQRPERADSFQNADDFLAHPILYAHDGAADIQALSEILGIQDQDIAKSEEFRTRLKPRIQPFMEEYYRLIQRMASKNMLLRDTEALIEQCEVLVGAMFNTARAVNRTFDAKPHTKRESDQTILSNLNTHARNLDELYAMAAGLAQYESLMIQGGSNCPVARAAGAREEAFIAGLRAGIPMASIAQAIGLEEVRKPYKFDKEGSCQKCHKSHEEAGLLGPCLVCRSCQKEFDRKEEIARMLRRFGVHTI